MGFATIVRPMSPLGVWTVLDVTSAGKLTRKCTIDPHFDLADRSVNLAIVKVLESLSNCFLFFCANSCCNLLPIVRPPVL